MYLFHILFGKTLYFTYILTIPVDRSSFNSDNDVELIDEGLLKS